jgi:hypothetical protein
VTSCEPATLGAQVGRLGNHAAANVLGNLDSSRDSGPVGGGSLFGPGGSRLGGRLWLSVGR